jgi:hypothetical protein
MSVRPINLHKILSYFQFKSFLRAGIAQTVQRRVTGWTAGVQFLGGERDFSLLHSVQTGSGGHPTSYPIATGGSFHWGKAAGA